MTRHDRPSTDQTRSRAAEIYNLRAEHETDRVRRLAFLVMRDDRVTPDQPGRGTQLAIAVLGVDAHPWVALVGLCDPEATEIAIHCACGRVDYGSTFASANRAHEAHRKGITE